MVYWDSEVVKDADAMSFNLDKGTDKNSAFYYNEKVTDSDPESIKRMSDLYSKDKNAVYYRAVKIEGVDVSTVEPIAQFYIKDAYSIFFCDKLLTGINAGDSSFTILGNFFSKNNKIAFYENNRLDVDAETFGWVEYCAGRRKIYLKDKNHIYFFNNKDISVVEGADIVTFNIKYHDFVDGITYDYSSDKNFVFSGGVKLENSHSESFELLQEGYAKDKNNVYYRGKIVDEADSETFVSIDKMNTIWQDKNNVYKFGKVLQKLK